MNATQDAHDSGEPVHVKHKGALAWMASNSVAANLLMFVMVVGGLIGVFTTKQEVFPEFSLDMVSVNVVYPGASPFEIEQGITLAVEERVRGLDGVKRVNSTSNEGSASISIELLRDANPDQVLADVKSEIDRIQTFPEQAEEPVVSLARNRRQVISLIIAGNQELTTLHDLAERARTEMLASGELTQVEIEGIAPLEISVELSRETLQQYGLTLQGVAQTISESSLELAAGGIDTASGELLVRVADRKRRGHELDDIVVTSTVDGAELRLGDIATIRDGFEEQDRFAFFNGEPAVRITAYRVGDETPNAVADSVKEYARTLREQLPPGITVSTWNDDSEILRSRVNLLGRNAVMGFFLVIGILALFLDLRLAFWVALGIPISFLGSFLVLGPVDLSINMITLFAFIVTLGMVVDDAIVVGERAHSLTEEGYGRAEAAVMAAKELLAPITFAILTSVAAFAPMLFVPGTMGKIFRMIPAVVIAVLLISLLESFLILPAHLSHGDRGKTRHYLISKIIGAAQDGVSHGLDWFSRRIYRPVLTTAIRFRYIASALSVAFLVFTMASVVSGKIPYNFFPALAGDIVKAEVRLPYGIPLEQTRTVQEQLETALNQTVAEFHAEKALRGSYTRLGESAAAGGPGGGQAQYGSHLVGVEAALVSSEERDFESEAFAQTWRKHIGEIARAESLVVGSSMGPGAGDAVALQLVHPDNDTLAEISMEVETLLRKYSELKNVRNEYSSGKTQLSYRLRPEARALGLNAGMVAQQLRAAFYGAESIREQRGRNELKIVTRLPKEERSSEYDLEQLRIRTPNGGEVPLRDVVELERGRSATSILREDGRRTITVSAELAEGVPSARPVLDDLDEGVLDQLRADHPGLEIELVGAQREQGDAFKALALGQGFALFVIYALLAIPFRSYIQPVIIMAVIPFGVVGAILGHAVTGYTLSIMSLFGIVALSGVVVNDSIVLIDAVNRLRREGLNAFDALVKGGQSRLRPILLTSLTTYFGLVPMLAEKSVQAKFLIPMAVSLGYGILFATVIVLILVPAFYHIVEDFHKGAAYVGGVLWGNENKTEAQPATKDSPTLP